MSPAMTRMHEDLLAALGEASGLILVTGPTGNGKTTAIEQVLVAPGCPPDVVFIGDLRGEVDDAFRALQLARSQAVVAVLRISRAAGAFGRLSDMGVPATDLAEIVRSVFSTRLIRESGSEPVLLHERLVMTSAMRALLSTTPDEQAIHHQAIADGMRSLRQVGMDYVRDGRLTATAVTYSTPDDHPSPGPKAEPPRVLYRPVGPKELALIVASGYRELPPRLPEQPIFYPVTNEEYARHIAEQWNVKESGSGYVTRFAVREDFMARYPEQQVGARLHTEYWIPAEDLAECNRNIVGLIEVIASFDPETST
jgi:hypothetical protein